MLIPDGFEIQELMLIVPSASAVYIYHSASSASACEALPLPSDIAILLYTPGTATIAVAQDAPGSSVPPNSKAPASGKLSRK